MDHFTQKRLNHIYPTAVIRGTQITRMEENRLGRFLLTAETAETLGDEDIGVFVGGFNDVNGMMNRVREIDRHDSGGRWIIVPSTRSFAAVIYQRWLDSSDDWYVDSTQVPNIWRGDNITFCLPESLSLLAAKMKVERTDVAGIVLIDPQCIMHRARGFHNGDFRVRHDRPQLITDFRSRLAIGGWSPPLVFFSTKPAKSVPTDSIRSVYCLEALYFLDGATLRCHPLPPLSASTNVSRPSAAVR